MQGRVEMLVEGKVNKYVCVYIVIYQHVFCTTYHLDILETLNDEYTYTCVQHPPKDRTQTET